MEKAENKHLSGWKKTYIGTGVLSIITVVLLVTLLALTCQWANVRKEALKGEEHDVCVQCGSLSDPDPEKNDTDLCCRTISSILQGLIGKYSKMKFAEHETSRMLSAYGNDSCTHQWVPVAVKLSGLNRDAQVTEADQLVHFKDNTDINKEQFKHENGALHVQKRGFYHIYSQIKITSTQDDTDNVYRHWIHHYSRDGTDRKILESSKSSCESVSDQNEITLMHGAVFELNEGDRVTAMTSHPHGLSPSDHGHFFGMYSISNSYSE